MGGGGGAVLFSPRAPPPPHSLMLPSCPAERSGTERR